MNRLRKLYGIGTFLAKNFWQFYRLGNIKYSSRRDLEFGLVGPGGRGGLNWIFGHPPDLMKSCSADASAFFYSDLANNLRKKMSRMALLKVDPGDNNVVTRAKMIILHELRTIEGAQFLACEWSKIINYCLHGNICYGRLYWSSLEDSEEANAAED